MRTESNPRVAYITAGAGGMYCGSCMRDNTLVVALRKLGYDVLLIPTYTPIRTDEEDASHGRVFFGGINVFLQQKSWLFRVTPWFIDRLLDFPRLLRWVSKFAVKTEADQLGELAVSMLQGSRGKQKKEVKKLAHFLKRDFKPHLINLTNALISGMVEELKAQTSAPVLCTLQGDDIFTEALTPKYRDKCLNLIRENCKHIDGFVTTSRYYADFMSDYFQIPREKIDVVYPGLNLHGHGGERPAPDPIPTIGYFARICPEKGLHNLIEAYRILRKTPGSPQCRLRISGWLGENNREYFEQQKAVLTKEGLGHELHHEDSPDHLSKVRFFQSIDILSVPTTYHEPKGIYILEALANGVPVVQPRHGSFPELIEETGGGLLVEPNNPEDLARGLHELLNDVKHREELARKGKEAVLARFQAEHMAQETARVYDRYLKIAEETK